MGLGAGEATAGASVGREGGWELESNKRDTPLARSWAVIATSLSDDLGEPLERAVG
jgi:hypothetical protein